MSLCWDNKAEASQKSPLSEANLHLFCVSCLKSVLKQEQATWKYLRSSIICSLVL